MATESADSLSPKKGRFFYGWWIVFTVGLSHIVGAGAGVPVFGLFFRPMSQEFGWTYTQTTLGITMRSTISQLLAALMGRVVDHYGPRVIMTAGAFIVGLAT